MAALPKEIQYNKPVASLPMDTQMNNITVRPSNSQSFLLGGEICQFDLPAHSFLVGTSMTLRGRIKISAATAGATQSQISGVPAASWIQRVETIVGGALLESVNDYGRLYNMIGQTKIDYATKAGLMTELAYGANAQIDPKFFNLNGRTLEAPDGGATGAQDIPFSLPLGCLLSSCSELIPLGHMGGVRIQITTAQLVDFVTGTLASAGNGGVITLENLELNFNLVDFGSGMDSVVRSMADQNGDLVLRSQGWNVSNVNWPANTGANAATYIYNVRLSSIKSLVLQGTGEAKDSTNLGKYDAVRAAGTTGSTQFFVANRPFPPTPLREANNAAVMSALRQAFGEAHDVYSSNIAIPQKQWVGIADLVGGTASTVATPASHFVGVNTEKLSTNAVMMSGESSQLSPINVRLETSEATDNAATLTLYACFDALITLNLPTRMVAVRV